MALPLKISGPLCAILCSIILLANHFSRDAPGTIEEQLSVDPNLNVTPARYATLTAVYFTPSSFIPFFLGLLSTNNARFSPEWVFLGVAWICVLGNIVSAVAVSVFGSYHGLVAGRAIAGVAYEAVDMLPLGIIPQMVPGKWASWSGFLNGLLRLGSAFAFLCLPRVYNYGGTSAVFIVVAVVVGVIVGPLATLFYIMVRQNRVQQQQQHHQQQIEQQQEEVKEEKDENNQEKNINQFSPKAIMSTFRSMPRVFWIYSLIAMTMYGSVVPFWFYGSGYLQRSRGLSLSLADGLMVLPEGAIVVLSTPVGLAIDRYKLNFASQQKALLVACICIALSHLLLLSGVQPAALGVVALGCSYAVSNQLLWSAFPNTCPENLSSLGAGIMACSINVGATLVPALIGAIRVWVLPGMADVAMLLLLGSLALVAAVICRLSVSEILRVERLNRGYEEVSEVVVLVDTRGENDEKA